MRSGVLRILRLPGVHRPWLSLASVVAMTASYQASEAESAHEIAQDVASRLVVETEPEEDDLLSHEVQDPSRDLFSFRAENVDLKRVLAMFARSNGLNIVPDLDIIGDLTVDFRNLPLDLAMKALLDAHGFYFVKEGELIRVRNVETRLFQVDYMRIKRSGQGANSVQISSAAGSSGGSQAGGSASSSSGGEGSNMVVTADSSIDFWSDLRMQLEELISPEGSFSINSLSGVITVTDRHGYVLKIADFIDRVSRNIVRQIDLEVEIYEVKLSEQNKLGINWSRVSENLDTTFTGGLIISEPRFGTFPGSNSISISHNRGGTSAVLEALQEQGELRVVSKPRLRTLNNQPAVIRVGQDLPVFFQTITTTPSNPPVITTNEEVKIVTIGTVLSVTPQISAEGVITLDISPSVSRLVRNEISAVTGASAPIIDIRQASSIVRIRDGDTIVMGGLVQDGSTETVRKIPILGDIPIVGRAFTATFSTEDKTELVIFLTPRIIDPHSLN